MTDLAAKSRLISVQMLVGVSVRSEFDTSEDSESRLSSTFTVVGVLALHREGSYSLDPGATTEQITMSEVAG